MIKISNQDYVSQLGKRNNNEDNFGINKGLSFVVCDGVGGSDKGEIASEIVVRSFIDAFRENENADANIVLKNTEDKLSAYIKEHPDALGMATTLTFSQVRENGIYIAWVGDSRIYQFRNGDIIFKTTDHSWVNEALKSGIINAAEAINHPKSNIITRAVQGNHKPTTADTRLLTDIQKGDLFLHCSDGVLESWDDDSLKALFSSKNDPKIIVELINNDCSKNSKDNYTAIVYKIEESTILKTQPPVQTNVTYVDAIPLNKNEFIAKKSNSTVKGVFKVKILGLPLIAWLCVFIPVVSYFAIIKNKKEAVDPPKTTVTKPKPTTIPKQESIETASSTIKLDSLKGAGWSTSRPSKQPGLTKLEEELNDLSEELEKLSIKKGRNKKDTIALDNCNKKIKVNKDQIKSWYYDSLKVDEVFYYDKEWKQKKIDN
jgi:protein phosphatase